MQPSWPSQCPWPECPQAAGWGGEHGCWGYVCQLGWRLPEGVKEQRPPLSLAGGAAGLTKPGVWIVRNHCSSSPSRYSPCMLFLAAACPPWRSSCCGPRSSLGSSSAGTFTHHMEEGRAEGGAAWGDSSPGSAFPGHAHSGKITAAALSLGSGWERCVWVKHPELNGIQG